jgi:hypothetical protein
VWAALLWLFFVSVHRVLGKPCPDEQQVGYLRCAARDPYSLWATSLSALPKIFTFVAALVIKRSAGRRYDVLFPDGQSDSSPSTASAQNVWAYEASRAHASLQRAIQHAGLLGSLTSITLMICFYVVLCLGSTFDPRAATAVGSAVAVTFILELSLALVRAAADDASTRMFARSARAIVTSLVTSLIASGFLASSVNNLTGAMLVGISCALLGSAALGAMTVRAGGLIGVSAPPAQNVIELSALEGLTRDDAERLKEEGVDSVHALAFCPTARLFFSTKYSLQRICDWQDQALLIAYVGTSLVGKLREEYLVRGALDAQFLANAMMNLQPTEAHDAGARRAIATMLAIRAKADWEVDVAKNLGFTDVEQARIALSTLVNDELIDRLRLYWRAAMQVTGDPDDD